MARRGALLPLFSACAVPALVGAAASKALRHPALGVPSRGVEIGGPVMWFGDVAPDQRPSDAFSLVYETPPLEGDVEILGLPRVPLQVSADSPHANWFARLNDVAPGGTVTLVGAAGHSGTHRVSAQDPTRFAVGNAAWPMLWPTRYPTTTALHLGADGTRLLVPVVPPADRPRPSYAPIDEKDDRLPGFESIGTGTPSGYGEIASVERSPRTGAAKIVATHESASRHPWGEEYNTECITHETNDDRPEATSVKGEYTTTVKLKDRTLRWESSVVCGTSDPRA